MLSVLFLGTRMRALQLSGGKPDDHGLPQDWVKMCPRPGHGTGPGVE